MPEGRQWRWKNFPVPETHLGLLAVGVVTNLAWQRRIGPSRQVRSLGLPLMAAGVGLAVWSTRAAGEVDLERPGRIVTHGPYSRSRHPMYLAWTLAYVGVALTSNNRWLLRLLPVLAILMRREVLSEERRLEEAFGTEYVVYASNVRRYL